MRKTILHIIFSITILLIAATNIVHAQVVWPTPTDSLPGDPGGLYVYTVQNMSFGAFARGNNGGTVIISNAGFRTVTGDIVPLSLGVQYFNAIFDIESPPGNIINILNGPAAVLNGSNGGTITLNIGSSDPFSPFVSNVAPPNRTQVNVGGTLVIGNLSSSPPGTYSGVFYITFNQE